VVSKGDSIPSKKKENEKNEKKCNLIQVKTFFKTVVPDKFFKNSLFEISEKPFQKFKDAENQICWSLTCLEHFDISDHF